MEYYGIRYYDKTAIFYKAVHRIEYSFSKCRYVSDYDNGFEYFIGRFISDKCDPNIFNECSNGIHISNINFALHFGEEWDDIAILELQTKIDDIIIPRESNGQVRTSNVKVLREVPLEECGTFGKILAKRRNR